MSRGGRLARTAHAPHFLQVSCSLYNARALVVATLARPYYSDVQRLDRLVGRYLSFLRHAFDPETATFRSTLGYDRRRLGEEVHQDGQGRAL